MAFYNAPPAEDSFVITAGQAGITQGQFDGSTFLPFGSTSTVFGNAAVDMWPRSWVGFAVSTVRSVLVAAGANQNTDFGNNVADNAVVQLVKIALDGTVTELGDPLTLDPANSAANVYAEDEAVDESLAEGECLALRLESFGGTWANIDLSASAKVTL